MIKVCELSLEKTCFALSLTSLESPRMRSVTFSSLMLLLSVLMSPSSGVDSGAASEVTGISAGAAAREEESEEAAAMSARDESHLAAASCQQL